MARTRLPNRLTSCPECGGDLEHHEEHRSITCQSCDRWARVRAPDPDDALQRFSFTEIVEHARPHSDECLCVACRFARAEGAANYI